MNFIVLSSSRGTTFQATLDSIADGSLKAACIGLVTDDEDRECIAKAEAAGLPWKVARKVEGEDREVFDKKVDAAIQELLDEVYLDRDDVILAEMGWMWIHLPWFIGEWSGKILNVHPALLPKHGGKGMYGDHVHRAVLDAGERESGITIHIMDEGVDTGQILVQKICTVEPTDTVETLRNKVQALEKEWFPKVLQMIEEGEIEI